MNVYRRDKRTQNSMWSASRVRICIAYILHSCEWRGKSDVRQQMSSFRKIYRCRTCIAWDSSDRQATQCCTDVCDWLRRCLSLGAAARQRDEHLLTHARFFFLFLERVKVETFYNWKTIVKNMFMLQILIIVIKLSNFTFIWGPKTLSLTSTWVIKIYDITNNVYAFLLFVHS